MLVNKDHELSRLRRQNAKLHQTCEDLITALQQSVHLTINQKAEILDHARTVLASTRQAQASPRSSRAASGL